MEHLLNPEELVKYQRKIVRHPWFGFDHDGRRQYPVASSLRQYAQNRGWTDSQVNRIEENPCSLGMTGLAMLQSMLFFGVWEAIIGESIPSSDFLVGSPANLKLSTENLRPLMQQTQEILHSGELASLKSLKTLQLISDQIFTTLEEVVSWEGVLLADFPGPFSLAMNILQRQTALAKDNLEFLYYQIPCEIRKNLTDFCHLRVNEGFYRDLLRVNNLCPSYYEYLDYIGVSAMEYFCVTGSFKNSVSDHLSCSTSMCVESKISVSAKKASHLQPDCICRSVSILSARVGEALASDNYFVIDILRLLDVKQAPSEAIVPYRSGLTYVAFSHVWSHGLGNIADQGLPVCRLKYLKKLIFSLKAKFGPISHFWIDAMCIPEDANLKKKSIGIMDQIYRNATVVMALDSMLQTLSLGDLTYESLALSILLSDWNQRLWILQEAKLATTLVIVLKGRWIDIQSLYHNLSDKIVSDHGTPVTLFCAEQLGCLTQHAARLFEWMPLLQFRSCSVSTDEPLVISALTGLDTRLLVQEEGELRMAKFWALMGRVPSGILFHISPKLKVDNYRWAPQSLMGGCRETGVGASDELDSEIKSNGLRASYFTVDFRDEPILDNLTNPVIIEIHGARLKCYNRDKEIKNSTQMLDFDALAFARDPLVHRVVLPNTPLSAVALKWISSAPEVTRYILRFPVLAEVEDFPFADIKNRVALKKSILIS